MRRGFLYIANGRRWADEAATSLRSLRAWHPDVEVAIFTDDPAHVSRAGFDVVCPLPERAWVRSEPKVWGVGQSPFERTVFLDTDTRICGDLSELFEVLDRFDFAAVPVPRRNFKRDFHAVPADMPAAFQCPNGGMLVYRDSAATKDFLADWWDRYQADRITVDAAKAAGHDVYILDQPSLQAALWQSDCQMLLLPPEYNTRTLYYKSRPLTAVGRVRIIHGRVDDMDALDRRWNKENRQRLLTPLPRYAAREAARWVLSIGPGQPLLKLVRRLRKHWRRRRLSGR